MSEDPVAYAEGTPLVWLRRYSDRISRVLSGGVVYVLLAVALVVFGLTAPDFFSVASLRAIGQDFAPVAVVSIGMTFVIIAAEIDLSVASTTSLGGVVTAAVLMNASIPWYIALFLGLMIGAALGIVNGLIVGYVRVPSFLVTLGSLEAIGALALIVTGTLSIPITNSSFLSLFGTGNFVGIPLGVCWTALVVALAVYVLHYTSFGRAVFAVGGSKIAAQYAGINQRLVTLSVLIISGLLAAFAGVLLAGRVTSGSPTSGVDMELTAIAAVILGGTDLFGGRGSIAGTVVGALFLSVLQVGLVLIGMSAQALTFATGIIVMGVVTVNAVAGGSLRPNGR